LKLRKILEKALSNPQDVRFNDFVRLVESFGFIHLKGRGKGSHELFKHPDILKLVNLQEIDGKVKPYQVRQFLVLVERYDLRIGDD
jgi:predicted RNA binding protein YcfA (HicA-like mRNA interferase family)